MKKLLISVMLYGSLSGLLFADEKGFIKTANGYIRAGYQDNAAGIQDMSIGGKLHIETKIWNGLLAGTSFYTSQAVGSQDGGDMIFFDSDHGSYSILGEAYIQANYGNTMLKIGRQELNTPFADTDDNGMVPNTFEAYVLTNTDIQGTRLLAAYISKMAGIDGAIPEKFTDLGMEGGISTLAVIYEGLENLTLQGWHYHIRDLEGKRDFTYFDALYADFDESIGYEIAMQYVTQDALSDQLNGDAKIYGISAVFSHKQSGISLSAAYNYVDGSAPNDGFGGGPFYTSAENLTLSSGGADAKASYISAKWNASDSVFDGLVFTAGYFTLENIHHVKSTELNLALSYIYNDHLSLDVIYYDTDDRINAESYKSTRVFANYTF